MNRDRLYHLLFLPLFGDTDAGFVFNIATVLIFIGLYVWHVRRDHRRSDQLIDEVKKLREELKRK